MSQQPTYVCAYCASVGVSMRFCSACKNILYCSTACQKKDWHRHQKYCGLDNANGDSTTPPQSTAAPLPTKPIKASDDTTTTTSEPSTTTTAAPTTTSTTTPSTTTAAADAAPTPTTNNDDGEQLALEYHETSDSPAEAQVSIQKEEKSGSVFTSTAFIAAAALGATALAAVLGYVYLGGSSPSSSEPAAEPTRKSKKSSGRSRRSS